MENFIDEKGFTTKPQKDHAIAHCIIYCCLFAIIFILSIKYHKINLQKPQGLKQAPVTIIQHDTIFYSKNESRIIEQLRPELYARETFSAKMYCKDYNKYLPAIGYGHIIRNRDEWYNIMVKYHNNITKHQADSIYNCDMQRAFIELYRVEHNRIKQSIFNIYISGKIKLYANEIKK